MPRCCSVSGKYDDESELATRSIIIKKQNFGATKNTAYTAANDLLNNLQ